MKIDQILNNMLGAKITEAELITKVRQQLGYSESYFQGYRRINAKTADKLLIRNRKTGDLKLGVMVKPQLVLLILNGEVVCSSLCNLKTANEVEFWR